MTKERGGGIIFLLVGIYGVIFSSTLPLGQWSEPRAGVFPLCVSILLCVSGISWLIAGKPKRGEETAIDWRSVAGLVKTPFLTIVITAFFVIAMTQIGYLAGSMFFLFLILLFISHYRVRTALALAITLGIGGWLFFVKLLSIQLPTVGIWIF